MTKQEVVENIKRLEYSISLNIWNKGYITNCKTQIKAYRRMLNVF